MNEILKMINNLSADDLAKLIQSANILLEKKRKEEAEQKELLEKERLRQEKIAQEKKRQQEIAELKRKLAELEQQNSAADSEPVKGDGFVMSDHAAPKHSEPAKPKTAESQSYQMVACPHCHKMNPSGSTFCASCGKNMHEKPAPKPEPKPAESAGPKPPRSSCPMCKTLIPIGALYCPHCYYNMSNRPEPNVKPAAPQVTVCPHCGHRNPAGSVFCEGCGQKMTVAKSAQPAAQPAAPQVNTCPHCGHKNPAGSVFCEGCGQKMTAAKPAQPAAASKPAAPQANICPHCGHRNPAGAVFCEGCGQKMNGQAAAKPQPAAQPAASSRPGSRIHYAEEGLKEWTKLQGEKVERHNNEVYFISPDMGSKHKYYIEVTNMRLLFTREGSTAASLGLAARMGGGLVGSLVANGIKAATNTGPKPYMAIPLSAITNFGPDGKKGFFIEAGERIVLRNSNFDKLLPPLIEKARQNGY